jgi:hypothetical protein
MRHLLAAVALLVAFALPALAVGPQDVTLTFTTRTGGGPVTGYRLYVNDQLKGTVVNNQPVAAAIPGNGTYKFCVNAFNATGETAGGNCLTRTVGDSAPAPTDVLTVTFACELAASPVKCTVTSVSQP